MYVQRIQRVDGRAYLKNTSLSGHLPIQTMHGVHLSMIVMTK